MKDTGFPYWRMNGGYSSDGELETEAPDPALIPEGLNEVCYTKKWFNQAEGGHTPQVQADYFKRGHRILHNIRIALVPSCSAGGMPIIAITAVRRTALRNATGDSGYRMQAQTGLLCGKRSFEGVL